MHFDDLVDVKKQKNYELVIVGLFKNRSYTKRLQEHTLNKILGKKRADFRMRKEYSPYHQSLLLKNL